MRIGNYKSFWFLIFSSLTFFDQASKYIIRQKGEFYICNPFAAFGIPLPKIWLLSLELFLIILLVIWLVKIFKEKRSNYWNKAGIVLILTGALSNLIDKLFLGCVLDFLQIPFWPLFNLADIWISIGGIILAVQIVKNSFLCPQK